MHKRHLLALLVAAHLPMAWAQAWPTKPIKIVVPSAAGSAPDTMTRLLAIDLQKRLGQSVVAENKPGAGGALGAYHGGVLSFVGGHSFGTATP